MKKAHLISLVAVLCLGTHSVQGQSLNLTLEECLRLAEENNAYVKNAELDIRGAELQRKEALWEYFPQVSAMALGYYAAHPLLEIGITDVLGHNEMAWEIQNRLESLGAMYGLNTKFTGFQKGYSASVSLIQPVFAGGRIVHGNQLAALGVKAARLQNTMQKKKTAEEIESLWWEISSIQDKIDMLDYLDGTLSTLYSNVSKAIGSGLASEVDILQLDIKRSELKAGKKKAESGMRLLKMNLLNSIGVEYTAPDSIRLSKADIELKEPQEYWQDEERIAEQMPERELLTLQQEAKELEKKMVIGEALPQMGIGVTSGYSDIYNPGPHSKGNINTIAFATVQIPLSDWGKISRKAQRIETQVRKAENEKEFLSKQLKLQVEKNWMELTSTYDLWQIAIEKFDIADRLYRVALSNYEAGLISIQDLLQAETTLHGASNEKTDATIAYRNAIVAYTNLFNN